MRLAILRTGQTNAAIRASFPDYPDLYENLLNNGASRIKGAFSFRYFAVFNGEMPADPDEFDGYIITGSAAGEIYSKRLTVQFVNKIREEKKFENLDMLKSQIQKDITTAKNLLK